MTGRAVIGLLSSLLLLTIAADLARPPGEQRSASIMIAGIHFYQRHLSGYMAAMGAGCRYRPTCSLYAETVIRRDGVVLGGWRAIKRVVRCGPWTPMGTADPP
ncbi:MAG: membrane protein insertion efficiency factor YidD [Vicinamibacterales bacterium]